MNENLNFPPIISLLDCAPLNDDITICDIGTITITAHSIKNIYDIASAIFPPTVRGCLSERYKSFFLFLNILIIPTPS